jgi:hypothetical protein
VAVAESVLTVLISRGNVPKYLAGDAINPKRLSFSSVPPTGRIVIVGTNLRVRVRVRVRVKIRASIRVRVKVSLGLELRF